ncbi:class I SAM-dependent methyltransferase [Streptomyces sp. NPDC088124]|uniref:class I SAM-dependent methyltransferase n=1 Tax=Streptomyces sp. NPDC088124 TaxID=3154654 RepID=UPI003430F489
MEPTPRPKESQEIDAALLDHPCVRQALTTADGSASYVVPRAWTGDELRPEQLTDWHQVFESLYAAPEPLPLGEHFGGWFSTYDGSPIPLDEMRQWRDATVARVLALRPRRLLEIGAGSGLLLAELAPHCDEYWATDYSARAVALLDDRLRAHPSLAGRVRLRCAPAHVVDGLPAGHFDTVVLNSVIQYFPDDGHLLDVIGRALSLTAPDGSLFLGDVRTAALERCFHCAVRLHRADGTPDRATLLRGLADGLAQDKELHLDPGFFTALPAVFPRITAVDLQIKEGPAHNELTRYRYDVVLRTARPTAGFSARRVRWGAGAETLAEVAELLTGLPAGAGALRLESVPNARIAAEAAALCALDAGAGVAAAKALLHTAPPPSLPEPDALRELGARLGYAVTVAWSPTDPTALDAVFRRDGARTASGANEADEAGEAGEADAAGDPVPPGGHGPAGPPAPGRLTEYAATPAAIDPTAPLAAALRAHLAARLPAGRLPGAIVVLPELPAADQLPAPFPVEHDPRPDAWAWRPLPDGRAGLSLRLSGRVDRGAWLSALRARMGPSVLLRARNAAAESLPRLTGELPDESAALFVLGPEEHRLTIVSRRPGAYRAGAGPFVRGLVAAYHAHRTGRAEPPGSVPAGSGAEPSGPVGARFTLPGLAVLTPPDPASAR